MDAIRQTKRSNRQRFRSVADILYAYPGAVYILHEHEGVGVRLMYV